MPTYYVSPKGNDAWSGTLPDPTRDGTDGPLATVERARDAARVLRQIGPWPSEGVSIILRGGDFPVSAAVVFTDQDSGTAEAPLVIRSYPGERARLLGGRILSDWPPVTDPAVLARLDPIAREHVIQIDLRAQGITDYGEVLPGPHRLDLFFRQQYMTIARYPNEGWVTIADVPQDGECKFAGEYRGEAPLIMDGVVVGRHCGRFRYEGERPSRWATAKDVWLQGYWVWDWSDEYQQVARIDPQAHEIYPAEPYHRYGYRKGQRYYYLNVLEELDAPGEWYIDRVYGLLYFWPPAPAVEGELVLPTLEQPILALEGASYVTISGITFESSRGGGIAVRDGTATLIVGCTVRNVGDTAILIEGGIQNGVQSCDIYEVGSTGIDLGGGDRLTLTSAGNYAVNNDIHHFARVQKTYRPGIQIRGVGNRIAHNYIHDAPHAGVLYEGNDHVIEFNEFTRVAEETGDVGAIYTCMDWTYMGIVIRHNYFHHIHGPGDLGCMTVYLDLPVGGAYIYGNIFYRLDRGFFTNSGRSIHIENNIFVDCHPAIGFNAWRYPYMFQPGGSWKMVERLEAMNYRQPPYSTHYPDLLHIFEDGDPCLPRDNVIARNVSYGGTWFTLYDHGLDFEILSVRDNLIADHEILARRRSERKGYDTYGADDHEIVTEYEKYGNIVMSGNPGFVDVEGGNLELRDDSPAWKLGFERIPLEEIGLYIDEYRASLP